MHKIQHNLLKLGVMSRDKTLKKHKGVINHLETSEFIKTESLNNLLQFQVNISSSNSKWINISKSKI